MFKIHIYTIAKMSLLFMAFVVAFTVLFIPLAEIYSYFRCNPFEKCEMYAPKLKDDFDARGIYVRDRYYCVWTKDTNESTIASVREHEICHHLVNNDLQHFCLFDEEGCLMTNIYYVCPSGLITDNHHDCEREIGRQTAPKRYL